MEHDLSWKAYLSDDTRYADIINGIVANGIQLVSPEDLQELDTQTGFIQKPPFIRAFSAKSRVHREKRMKIRDTLRRVAFGVSFAIIGIENQELPDYSLPLRNISYDVSEYEKQAARIRKAVRSNRIGLSRGEYLYGFRKDSRLQPVMTLILYFGADAWDGPESLHQMLDFTDIPEYFKQLIPDYQINLIQVRKLTDTSVFQTDVRQVFDFIRCAEDKQLLKQLITKDTYYQSMEADAFDVVVQYANATELMDAKKYYQKDGKIDMCKGITDWLAEEKELGIAEGKLAGIAEGKLAGTEEKTRAIVTNMLQHGMEDADIRAIAECEQNLIDEIRKLLQLPVQKN